uniref:Uncharacterized protein n=1 Tax=Glossina austeni TaxID=7395 RepID=A0A1A9VHW0_GLOAU
MVACGTNDVVRLCNGFNGGGIISKVFRVFFLVTIISSELKEVMWFHICHCSVIKGLLQAPNAVQMSLKCRKSLLSNIIGQSSMVPGSLVPGLSLTRTCMRNSAAERPGDVVCVATKPCSKRLSISSPVADKLATVIPALKAFQNIRHRMKSKWLTLLEKLFPLVGYQLTNDPVANITSILAAKFSNGVITCFLNWLPLKQLVAAVSIVTVITLPPIPKFYVSDTHKNAFLLPEHTYHPTLLTEFNALLEITNQLFYEPRNILADIVWNFTYDDVNALIYDFNRTRFSQHRSGSMLPLIY